MKRAIKWLVTFQVAGNLGIFLAHLAARWTQEPDEASWGAGALNAHQAGPLLWRSGKPTPETYQSAADAGVQVVVDLRAEGGDGPPDTSGLTVVHIPIRDGQAPDAESLATYRSVLDGAAGPVLTHCAAGVGRTGSMIAARQVLDEGMDPFSALLGVLAVGPPSLEQIAFVAGLPTRSRPPAPFVIASRILDAPRRTWSRIRHIL